MMLLETTTVPEAALPLSDFKAHLRMGTGFADDGAQDAVLHGFLRAALSAIEARTGKVLYERQFSWRVDRWRETRRVALPVAPVGQVGGFDIVDAEDVVTAIDAAGWRLVPDAQRPEVMMLSAALPTIPTGGFARFDLTAGFGPDWGDIPADLRQAVMMLAAHYYEYRHDTGLDAGCMPFGVSALIDRYRAIRVTGGGLA